MCGIVGIVSKDAFDSLYALRKLKKLEYRGYDSYGYFDGSSLMKEVGNIRILDVGTTSKKAILHTRWATHGGVTQENAHPHISSDGKIGIVHNGIIENYEELKCMLEKKGYIFKSQTDSEVVANYFSERLKTMDMENACQHFMSDIVGTFAVLLLIKGDDNIYALKRDSPLALGICKEKIILASDIYAFSDETDKAIFFENDEYAIISDKDYAFFDRHGNSITKNIVDFEWSQEKSEKKEYDHYMAKEIDEEPAVVKRLLFSLQTEQENSLKKFTSLIKDAKKIIFAACGTSYHAALLGVYYLHKCGIDAQALIGSEFMHFANIDKDTLVILVSQSGETMDLIGAVKYAKEKGAKIASIVNVPYSTIQRESEISLNVLAGQEVCVAATKSFVNQVVLLLAIAKIFGYRINLENIPQRISGVLEQKDKIKKIAMSISSWDDLYVLGRGLSYPVAREVALKIKEISYVHAEGMMGGELKHGTIALIEKGTPVIALISDKDMDMVSNAKEVEARGANVIRVSNGFPGEIMLDTSNDGKFGILSAVFGQLLAYYIALERDLPIDKPRNLAKSVTVK